MDPSIPNPDVSSIALVPVAIYGAGVIMNTLITMDQTGSDELDTYRKNTEFQKEQAHRSEYTAYWKGCRNGLIYGLFESAIWPVKLGTFVVYLLRKNANTK
jgi:hypothetical protein